MLKRLGTDGHGLWNVFVFIRKKKHTQHTHFLFHTHPLFVAATLCYNLLFCNLPTEFHNVKCFTQSKSANLNFTPQNERKFVNLGI